MDTVASAYQPPGVSRKSLLRQRLMQEEGETASQSIGNMMSGIAGGLMAGRDAYGTGSDTELLDLLLSEDPLPPGTRHDARELLRNLRDMRQRPKRSHGSALTGDIDFNIGGRR